MEEEKKLMFTIRGDRHSIEFTKEVKNITGFAPDYYDILAGEVVYNFPHDEECVYFQASSDMPTVLEKEDIEQILEVMNRKFDKRKWDKISKGKS